MLLQFAALTSDTIKQVRECCINQVMGTDMKKHFDITSRFQVTCALSHGIKSSTNTPSFVVQHAFSHLMVHCCNHAAGHICMFVCFACHGFSDQIPIQIDWMTVQRRCKAA